MRPLTELPPATARGLRGLLFDLDDTLLSHGRLTREAFVALWDLHDAGLRLVAVTGRPSGWGEVLVRQWPVDGAVTENGAIHVVRERQSSGVSVYDPCSRDEREARRARLERIVDRARSIVPEARLADDAGARRSDVTWDIGERAELPPPRVRLIADEIARAGARSTQSSVHLHATFDTDDKASGAVAFLSRFCEQDAGGARHHYAFIGDSGNDSACFSAFHTTFGVANVRAHLAHITIPPRFCASAPMGAGFAEVARSILSARAGEA